MHNYTVLSGKDVSDHVYKSLLNRVQVLKNKNIQPGLAAILIGENPASEIYIKMKTKKFHDLGLNTKTYRLPKECAQAELIEM